MESWLGILSIIGTIISTGGIGTLSYIGYVGQLSTLGWVLVVVSFIVGGVSIWGNVEFASSDSEEPPITTPPPSSPPIELNSQANSLIYVPTTMSPMTTLAPTTTMSPMTTLAPTTTMSPMTTLAPTTTMSPMTTLAPYTTMSPMTTLAPYTTMSPMTTNAPATTTMSPMTTNAPATTTMAWENDPSTLCKDENGNPTTTITDGRQYSGEMRESTNTYTPFYERRNKKDIDPIAYPGCPVDGKYIESTTYCEPPYQNIIRSVTNTLIQPSNGGNPYTGLLRLNLISTCPTATPT
jgi:hypothetical protein